MDLDEALDRLYGMPLEDFTSTRNALASELSGSGDPEGAKQVKSLRKPNLAAWAVNQLPRRHPDELDSLYEVTDWLRLAQRRVLSGGKASALREASDARSRVVSDLSKLAASILTEAGHAAAPATLAAVTSTLVAVATDEEGAELVRKGRLTRELRAETVVSADHGAPLTLVESGASPEPSTEAPDREEAIRAARTAVNDARERSQGANKAVREADAEVARRTREADEAERAAKAAREAAEFARRASEARRAEADEASKALEEAQRKLEAASGEDG